MYVLLGIKDSIQASLAVPRWESGYPHWRRFAASVFCFSASSKHTALSALCVPQALWETVKLEGKVLIVHFPK